MGLFDKLRGGSAKGAPPASGAAITPDQADALMAAVDDVAAAKSKVLAADIALRDHAMRAVARNRRETVLVDRPERVDPCLGLVTVTEDGQTLIVYEGEIVERDGTVVPVGEDHVTVPGVAILERGSTPYLNHVWQGDTELQAAVAARPELRAGLRDGSVTVRYVMVDAHADGRVSIAEFTLHRDQLELPV